MKNYAIVFTLLTFLLLVSSCSVEKRLYSSGYHVEWHNNKKRLHDVHERDTVNLRLINNSIKNQKTHPYGTKPMKMNDYSMLDPVIEIFSENREHDSSKLPILYTPDLYDNSMFPLVQENSMPAPTLIEDKKQEPLSIIALLISLLVLILVATHLLPAAVIAFTCSIAAFILSISSIIRNKRYPDKYKDKDFSLFMLFLSIVLIIISTYAVSISMDQLFSGSFGIGFI